MMEKNVKFGSMIIFFLACADVRVASSSYTYHKLQRTTKLWSMPGNSQVEDHGVGECMTNPLATSVNKEVLDSKDFSPAEKELWSKMNPEKAKSWQERIDVQEMLDKNK